METFTEIECADFIAGILKGDLGVELESGIATVDALLFDATLFDNVAVTVLIEAECDIGFDIVRVKTGDRDVIIENCHQTKWTKRLDGDSAYRREFMAVFHDRRPHGS